MFPSVYSNGQVEATRLLQNTISRSKSSSWTLIRSALLHQPSPVTFSRVTFSHPPHRAVTNAFTDRQSPADAWTAPLSTSSEPILNAKCTAEHQDSNPHTHVSADATSTSQESKLRGTCTETQSLPNAPTAKLPFSKP